VINLSSNYLFGLLLGSGSQIPPSGISLVKAFASTKDDLEW
jgi:hypothetical protein